MRTKLRTFLFAGAVLGLGAVAVGGALSAVAAAPSSGLYVDLRDEDSPDARVVERWKLYNASKALIMSYCQKLCMGLSCGGAILAFSIHEFDASNDLGELI